MREKDKQKNKENNNISYEYNNKKEETTINNQIRKAPENTFKFKINNIFFNNKEKSLPMISQEELLNSRFNSYKNILKKEIKYEKNININDNNKNISNIIFHIF